MRVILIMIHIILLIIFTIMFNLILWVPTLIKNLGLKRKLKMEQKNLERIKKQTMEEKRKLNELNIRKVT